MPETIITLLVFAIMGVGVAGAVLPGLPGLPIIFLAALGHKLLLPEVTSWGLIVGLGLVAVAGFGLDFLAGWAGAKMFGGSKWGVIGAVAGLILGLPFSLPGMIFGPIVGAVLAEVFVAKRPWKEASKSGLGAGVGFAVSTVVHLALALLMIGAFTIDLFV